jgi:hypothetical protein
MRAAVITAVRYLQITRRNADAYRAATLAGDGAYAHCAGA